MAAEISIFQQASTPMFSHTALLSPPLEVYTDTFTSLNRGIMRVYANGAAVTLTFPNTKAITIPSGTVEYFGIQQGVLITVS